MIQRRTPIARSTKPIRKRGKKAKAESASWLECKEAVRNRSSGACEVFDVVSAYRPNLADVVNWQREVCDGEGWHEASDVHHVWPEDRDLGRHDPDRMLGLCRHAHDWVHGHPELAKQLHLMRPDDAA